MRGAFACLPSHRGKPGLKRSLAVDAAGIPDGRLLILPGVGHVPWMERADEMTRAIGEFLVGTGSADRASIRN